MKSIIKVYIWGLGLMILFSCNKFLDEKPQKSLLVPKTAEEVRALLDYYSFFSLSPLIPFIMSDEWETTSHNWETYAPWQQNSYLWLKNVHEPQERSSDYQTLHSQMFYANTCLDLLGTLTINESFQISQMKGEALTIRSRVLFDLATLYLPGPQSSLTAEIEIPVNLTPDINAPLQTVGIPELLTLIKGDLDIAFSLLPEKADIQTRPDKRVAKGLLARIYLYEQNWDEALEAANYVIQNGNSLLEYKELEPSNSYPFAIFNQETVFYQQISATAIPISPNTHIVQELYESYQENDLRKSLFFRMNPTQRPLFKGSYTGRYLYFTGISLSEMYLTAAEASIRLGKVEEGLQRLNEFGATRYSDFEPWKDLTQEDALDLALAERKRELLFRGLRWMDMKRTKYLDASYQAQREIHGTVYTLKDEDQFILELPPYEVELGKQN